MQRSAGKELQNFVGSGSSTSSIKQNWMWLTILFRESKLPAQPHNRQSEKDLYGSYSLKPKIELL